MKPYFRSYRLFLLVSFIFVLDIGVSIVYAQHFGTITVDATGDDVGLHSSIALDSNNKPHISYYDATNGDLKYATKSNGTWVSQIVDAPGDVGLYTSIALDLLNNPYISYYVEGNEFLKLAYTETSGGPWEKKQGPNVRITTRSKSTSIVLNLSATNPIIVYFDDNDRNLELAMYDRAGIFTNTNITDNEDWARFPEIVTSSTYGMESISIALDVGSEPHICYVDLTTGTSADLMYAKKECDILDSYPSLDCLNPNSVTQNQPTGQGTWNLETIDPSGTAGKSASIALDSNGNPHISYYGNGYLKHARKIGGSWIIETVDNSGDVGQYNSMALDANDNPHISYYDATNRDLKYAIKTSGTWLIQTVDATGDVGLYNSIALDANSNPHISYYDATNGNLKYAFLLEDLEWEKMTFQPIELNCTNDIWTSSDIVIFTPDIRLSSPHHGRFGSQTADGYYIVIIYIMEQRTFMGIDWLARDHKIGFMSAHFRFEDTTPYNIIYPAHQQVNRDRGVPDPLTGGFWLVCTRKCKIKGNMNKTNQSKEKIYLIARNYTDSETGEIVDGRKGPNIRLHCK